MATKNPALRNSLVDAQSALYAAGSLRCYDSSGSLVVEFVLPDPAFPAAASGEAAANGTPISGTVLISKTITYAELWSNDGTYRVNNLSVGTSAGLSNVVVSDLTPSAGTTINLTELIMEEDATVGETTA